MNSDACESEKFITERPQPQQTAPRCSHQQSIQVDTEQRPPFRTQLSVQATKFIDDLIAPKFDQLQRERNTNQIPLKLLKRELAKMNLSEYLYVQDEMPEDLIRILEKADLNKDRQVDKNEFITFITDPENNFNNKESQLYIHVLYTAIECMLSRTHFIEIKILKIKHYIKTLPPPIFLLSVTLIQVVLLLFNVLFPLQSKSIMDGWSFDPTKKVQIWRLITYVFVHQEIIHFIPNIFLQIMAIPLELVDKSQTIFLIYFFSAVNGALASGIFFKNSQIIGNSSAVFGLIGGYIAYFFMTRRKRIWCWYLFIGIAILIIIYDVVDWLIVVTLADEINPFYCHISGAFSGCLIGLIRFKNRLVKLDKAISNVALIIFLIYLFALLVFFFGNSKK